MATINPFMQPINYAVDVQSPFEAALGGFKIGAGVAEIEAAKQARVKAQATQTELANLFKNPNATAADYDRVVAFLPKDQAAIVTQGFERKTKEQQQNDLRMGAEVYSAIKSGNLPVAKQRLTDKANALRSSGREDEAKATEDSIQLIDLNPTGAQATIGLYMARLPGGTDFLNNADKVLSTIRLEAQAPAELRQKIAAAEKAESDAKTAQATATSAIEKAKADAALAKAQADTAAIKLEYARTNEVLDVQTKGEQLGLTRAQIGSALATTKKLGVETQKAALELEALAATGGVDPVKVFDQEEKLRKEYQSRTKVYGELGSTYANIASSAKAQTGPGDIALITGFMKMLDPGSVVRETEFATARDTAGLYTRLENSLKKAENGQFLQANQRNEFVSLAKQYLDSAQKKAGEDKKALGVVVKNYKLNPENVFGPETVAPPETPSPNSVTVNGQTYTRPANFTDAQWNAYKQSMGVQ